MACFCFKQPTNTTFLRKTKFHKSSGDSALRAILPNFEPRNHFISITPRALRDILIVCLGEFLSSFYDGPAGKMWRHSCTLFKRMSRSGQINWAISLAPRLQTFKAVVAGTTCSKPKLVLEARVKSVGIALKVILISSEIRESHCRREALEKFDGHWWAQAIAGIATPEACAPSRIWKRAVHTGTAMATGRMSLSWGS